MVCPLIQKLLSLFTLFYSVQCSNLTCSSIFNPPQVLIRYSKEIFALLPPRNGKWIAQHC
ncbi:hypothetical protein RchiOBHm_Chr7g0208271 [Rosa chinensis]|uniref:Uncharacterized protein n=1 Tax=Rosa chinensis TaxID=74649 RepID=A0A2P6P9N5_ROSCH|nr:hypothetical protein RchiOBHm_Chr7g0208271 [Rosa chinensis]